MIENVLAGNRRLEKSHFKRGFQELPFENGYAICWTRTHCSLMNNYVSQKRILFIYVDLDIIQKSALYLENYEFKEEAFVQR